MKPLNGTPVAFTLTQKLSVRGRRRRSSTHTTPTYSMDVRPGGRWHTTMRRPDGSEHVVSGIYRAIEPPKRLVFTWGWDDDAGMRGHETEITVTFEPAPGGTRMTLVQQTFVDTDSRNRHEHGWGSSFVCLAREAVKPE